MLPRRQVALAFIIRRSPRYELPFICKIKQQTQNRTEVNEISQNRTTNTEITKNHKQTKIKERICKKKKYLFLTNLDLQVSTKWINRFDMDLVKGESEDREWTWDGHGESTTTAADVLPWISGERRIGERNRFRRQYRNLLRRSSGKVAPHVHHFFRALLLYLRIFHSFVSIHGEKAPIRKTTTGSSKTQRESLCALLRIKKKNETTTSRVVRWIEAKEKVRFGNEEEEGLNSVSITRL